MFSQLIDSETDRIQFRSGISDVAIGTTAKRAYSYLKERDEGFSEVPKKLKGNGIQSKIRVFHRCVKKKIKAQEKKRKKARVKMAGMREE